MDLRLAEGRKNRIKARKRVQLKIIKISLGTPA